MQTSRTGWEHPSGLWNQIDLSLNSRPVTLKSSVYPWTRYFTSEFPCLSSLLRELIRSTVHSCGGEQMGGLYSMCEVDYIVLGTPCRKWSPFLTFWPTPGLVTSQHHRERPVRALSSAHKFTGRGLLSVWVYTLWWQLASFLWWGQWPHVDHVKTSLIRLPLIQDLAAGACPTPRAVWINLVDADLDLNPSRTLCGLPRTDPYPPCPIPAFCL